MKLLIPVLLAAAAVNASPSYASDIAAKTVTKAETDIAAHAVTIRSDTLPRSTWHKTILPGETLFVDTQNEEKAYIDDQIVMGAWTAPVEAGEHTLKILTPYEEIARVTIFVLEPSSSISKKGFIGKYRIGHYPRNTPKGFIKLDKDDRNIQISPHFKVGQFLCKQQPGTWPKYLIVSEDNLLRLETLLDDLNENRDTEADTLFVMSGFRTPFYNTAIGSAKFSRHMYGDAADVYVDTKPRDGNMDDLNRDGKITKADANFLYDYAGKLFKEKKLKPGGIGSYKANAVHGPFVHVDARGRPARWGR